MSRVDTEHAVQNWLMYQIDSILLKTKGPKIKLDLYFLYNFNRNGWKEFINKTRHS